MLPGVRLPRAPAMKRQNFSISTTRSTASRTVSASVRAPSTLRARSMACASTKKDLRVYRTGLRDDFLIGICYDPYRHTSRLELWLIGKGVGGRVEPASLRKHRSAG